MELKPTIDIILKDLQEARKIVDDLKKYPGVPVLQIELAMAKCRSAEDVLRLLSELNEAGEFQTRQNSQEEEPGIDIIEPASEATELPLEIEGPGTDDKLATKGDGPDEHKDIIEEEIVEGSEIENRILADQYSHLSNRMNEQIRDNMKGNETVDFSKKVPVTDLTKSIGVNDRFYFIRELFEGDTEKYHALIKGLNRVASVEEANSLLIDSVESLAGSEPARQLLELVERKLSSASNE